MSQKQCFVISPIGQKGSEIRGHADDVFEFIIKTAMDRLSAIHHIDIKAERADHIQAIGPLSKQMFDRIINADICIALLTGHSPNVFYELAVAQAAARPVVVLIEKGQPLPFDVQDLHSVEYTLQPVKPLVDGVYADSVINQILDLHNDGWSAPGLFESYGYGRQHRYEQQMWNMSKQARPNPLPIGRGAVYKLPFGAEGEIEILTGNIADYETLGADVIVSLESIDLQIARFHDPWLSGTLRYLDAEKEPGGRVVKDTLQRALQKEIERQNIQPPIELGSVVATPANPSGLGKLGCHYVFHVAALQGKVGDGYQTRDFFLDDCVDNVFSQLSALAKENSELKTVLFPMLGAGTTGLEPVTLAEAFLPSIVKGVQADNACSKVYILAWLESHLHALQQVADKLGLEKVTDSEKTLLLEMPELSEDELQRPHDYGRNIEL